MICTNNTLFPYADYKMDYSLPLVRFLVKNAPAGKKNYFLNLKNAKLDNAKNPKKKVTDFITLVTVESS